MDICRVFSPSTRIRAARLPVRSVGGISMGSRSCFGVLVAFLSLAAPLVVAVPAASESGRPLVVAESAVLADVDQSYIGIDTETLTSDIAMGRVGAGATVLVGVVASAASDVALQDCPAVNGTRWGCLTMPLSPQQVDGSQLSRSDMKTVTDTTGTKTGYLHPDVAPYFRAMIDAYAADPQTRGTSLSFWSTYRSYETQLKAYNSFVNTGKNLAGREVANIAHPDNSLHPKGYAIDFAGVDQTVPSIQYQWLAANGHLFGFRGVGSSEPWHWEFDPSLLKLTTMGGPGVSPPTHNRHYPPPRGSLSG